VLCVFSALSSEQKTSVVSHAIGTIFCDTTAMQYMKLQLGSHWIPEKIKLTFCAIFRVCRSKFIFISRRRRTGRDVFPFQFEFLMIVDRKCTLFLDESPCNQVEVYRRFGGILVKFCVVIC
jgi:hypothetical protein